MELIGSRQSPGSRTLRPWALNWGPFPPPALPGFPATTNLSATPRRPGLSLAGVRLGASSSHRWGFPCCLSILLSHMPSPLPQRDRSSLVARCSTSGGLPHRWSWSAPALRVSRSAQRSLTLWPACLLTPYGAVSKSASVQVVTSLNRSRCYRLERPVTGRGLHPPESTRLSRHTDRRALRPASLNTFSVPVTRVNRSNATEMTRIAGEDVGTGILRDHGEGTGFALKLPIPVPASIRLLR